MTQTDTTKGRNKKKRGRGRIILWCSLAIVALALAIILPLLLNGARQTALVKIPSGATLTTLNDTLTRYFGESYAAQTTRLVKMSGADLSRRHGAYRIAMGTSPASAARRLTRGAQEPVKITINGQRTLAQMASMLSSRLDFTPDSLTAALADPELLRRHGLTPQQAMALFVDDSYEVYWSVSPSDLIEKIARNYDRLWNDTRREKASRLGMSPAEVMTLCSIVDEETNKADEKGKIARLYINRLERGMKLQADPTVKFAAGDFSIRRVQGVHLKIESPYNTYMHPGLPPGPIRSGSARTVDIVLDAPQSDDIYMCARADFSGYHDFAATYAEHQANARRYRQALDERGIK